MTNQQQPDPLMPTSEDLGAEWGMKLGSALVEKIVLRKQSERLVTISNEYAEHIRTLEAEATQMAEMIEATESGLSNQVRELQAKIAEFTEQEIDLVDQIRDLKAELDVLKTADRAAAITSQASKIINKVEIDT